MNKLPVPLQQEVDAMHAALEKKQQEQGEPAVAVAPPPPQAKVIPKVPPAPKPQAAPAATLANAEPQDYEKLKLAYETLKGKYSAEVPRLSAEKRQSSKDMDSLKAEIEALKANKGNGSNGNGNSAKPFYSDDEIEDHGSVLELTQRPVEQLRQDFGSQFQGVEQKLDELLKQRSINTEADFQRELDGLAPGWREKNESPEFIQFTLQPFNSAEPWGDSIKKRADAAWDQMNAVEVAKYFNAFQSPQAQPMREEDLAMPDILPSGTHVPQPQAEMIPHSVWEEQNQRILRKGGRLNEEDLRIIKILEQAEKEGRIQPGV